MSLNQKCLRSHYLRIAHALKAKKVKRTSNEGKKAFEAAYKAKIKDLLKDRLGWIEKEAKRVTEAKTELVANLKAAKKTGRKKTTQKKIGKKDKYIYRLEEMTKKTKQVQKSV